MPLQPRIGGSFAPPIDADKLAAHREVAESAPGPVKDAMLALATMVETFHQTPRSKAAGSPHPSGRGMIVPLEDAEIRRIDHVVPWDHEIDGIQALFDAIPADQKPLRDAAFHLLWFAIELSKDREPITSDQL